MDIEQRAEDSNVFNLRTTTRAIMRRTMKIPAIAHTVTTVPWRVSIITNETLLAKLYR